MSSRKAVSDPAVIVPKTPPKNAGSSRVRSVTRGTTPRLPPPPPLRAQKGGGVGAGGGKPPTPAGGQPPPLKYPRRCQTVFLREAAEAAALNQSRHAHRRAAATLNVAAASSCH